MPINAIIGICLTPGHSIFCRAKTKHSTVRIDVTRTATRGQRMAVWLTWSMQMKKTPNPIPASSGKSHSSRCMMVCPSDRVRNQTAIKAKPKPISLATGGSPSVKKANKIGITAATTAAIEETIPIRPRARPI